jgi:hypothetical protein
MLIIKDYGLVESTDMDKKWLKMRNIKVLDILLRGYVL